MTPRAVLIKTGLKPLNIARPVNTTLPKTIVYIARPMSCFSKLAQSTIKRPYQSRTTLTNKNSNQKVNTAKPKAVNTARPTLAVVNAVRINHVNAIKALACWTLRNLMEDMLPLGDEPDEEELLVKELLKMMCDKKNSVLFTEAACFVLSPDFKLPDESQVLLKVFRKNSMYSVDMKNIVPKESLTCLVAKATLDESMLWHRRLGHVNFKTINKLVKDNLVGGLPTKHFKNDQTCVACLKGKQHKASCKSKIQNSITQPLFMLHMYLFGPTFVSSLMNKKYCLVVTDDYSRFTWVFFLASKDETSGILKNFITEIENLVDKKAEAVNTACYVQNRVIIVKPHNKTPYELFRGRTPALSFMRQFRCHVTILNTLDHLGKFDEKYDDGFFFGYSLTSKAFRVYNIRTKKVEENLHIRFRNYCIGEAILARKLTLAKTTLWKYSSLFDSPSMNVSHDEPEPSCDAEKKDDEGVSKASGVDDQERPESSTPNINTVGPSINTASANLRTGSLHINTVSPTVLTTRSNRPQSVSDIISLRDNVTPEATNADLFGDETEMDMSNLNASYHVPTTPNTRIHKDHSLDHVDIVNKARLIAQGYTQEEGIDYDEVFAPVARIEAIRLFLAYASFMGFMVYQMDVKSAFIYGQIEEEVYVGHPLGFEDPDYPDKVYKVVKALYGLHQAPRAWYETLAKYLLDNGFYREKIDKTLFIKKQKGDILLVQVYVDDIIFGSTKKALCLEFEKLMHDKF
ncbi:putative ribonuclease H-like domain-containing protein [Tanacetum coccineum]